MEEQKYFTKKDVIEKYQPMFTEWSLSKLIKERKLKHIRIGRNIYITEQAVEEFIKSEEAHSLTKERGDLNIV